VQHHTKYFAITAAIGGVAGALGAVIGGWLAQFTDAGGMTGLFALSSVLRLVALLPLVWLQEPRQRLLGHKV
jgi:MFS family permease